MKRFLSALGFVLPLLVLANTVNVAAQITSLDNPDVASLKATHERMLKAWSDRDIETIVEICNGAVGFGQSTAFPRPIRQKEKS
jgi:cytochrome c oxidase assembly factor CtaG